MAVQEHYADVDGRLLQLADLVDHDLAHRIRTLVDADAIAHEVIDLRQRAQRAEDLTHEVRRQLRSRDRQCDRLQEQLAAARPGDVR